MDAGTLETAVKIGVSGLLGGLIVWERRAHHKPIGIAGMILVAIGSTTYMVFAEKLSAGRWCTRQIQGGMAASPKLLRDDRLATDGIRAPGRQHPVQHRHADGSLSLLGREAAGSQTRSDQSLVTTHCRFH